MRVRLLGVTLFVQVARESDPLMKFLTKRKSKAYGSRFLAFVEGLDRLAKAYPNKPVAEITGIVESLFPGLEKGDLEDVRDYIHLFLSHPEQISTIRSFRIPGQI